MSKAFKGPLKVFHDTNNSVCCTSQNVAINRLRPRDVEAEALHEFHFEDEDLYPQPQRLTLGTVI
jgi:hypothetical protein